MNRKNGGGGDRETHKETGKRKTEVESQLKDVKWKGRKRDDEISLQAKWKESKESEQFFYSTAVTASKYTK